MKYYEWSSQFQIYLYGINVYSKNLGVKKYIKGAKIVGYIDRNADDYKEVNGIKVWKPVDIKNLDKENICIFIMLQNAMQHDEIAQYLNDMGIEKIIYIPMNDFEDTLYTCCMMDIYNKFILEDYIDINKIPSYKRIKRDEISFPSDAKQKYYIVNVDADLIYTVPLAKVIGRKKLEEYADIPIIAYIPYYNMFNYYFGMEDGSIDEYLEDYGINSCNYSHNYTNQSIIKQRAELFEIWNKQIQKGMDFFVSSAPLAELNSKGYFNLLEGQHRSLFLIRKGIYQIPIRISREDFYTYIHREIEIEELYEKNKKLKSTILDVKFSLMESVLQIQRKLDRKYYQSMDIYCVDSFYGYYSRRFNQMGAGKVVIGVKDTEEEIIIRNINEIYKQKNLEIEILKNERIIEFDFICAICDDLEFKNYVVKNAKKSAHILTNFSIFEIQKIKYITKNTSMISKVFMGNAMTNIYLITL